MTDERKVESLPRGPHDLTREQVQSSQRRRLVTAMTQVVGEKGYLRCSVADVIQVAGVSRATFYQLFKDKEECFIAAFESANQDILAAMMGAMLENELPEDEAAEHPREALLHQLDAVLGIYLRVLATYPQVANTFTVEVYAVGPSAVQRRLDSLEFLISVLVEQVFPGENISPARAFAVRTFVHGVSSMVTMAVGTGRHEELEALREPLIGLATMMITSPAFDDAPESHAVEASEVDAAEVDAAGSSA